MALTRRSFAVGCVGLCAAATPLGWYSAKYEPAELEVTHREVTMRRLPARLDGLTVAQVSDLHLTHPGSVHLRMADSLRSLKPDLIFVTGDLVDNKSAVGDLVGLLGTFSAPLGVWAVPGNWDHTGEAISDLTTALPTVGVRFLLNESAQLEDGVWIVGVDDPATGNDDLDAALSAVPNGAHRLLLAHSPDIVPALAQTTFDLVLCGHTHGGQVSLPFLNGAWLKDGPARDYVQGFYKVHGSTMYVNRGIGTTTLPIRMACRPELTVFKLHAG